nr:MAG TPA: hypothetical protein [Caudoviricetes sp.]
MCDSRGSSKRGDSAECTTLLLIRRFAPPSPQGEGRRADRGVRPYKSGFNGGDPAK